MSAEEIEKTFVDFIGEATRRVPYDAAPSFDERQGIAMEDARSALNQACLYSFQRYYLLSGAILGAGRLWYYAAPQFTNAHPNISAGVLGCSGAVAVTAVLVGFGHVMSAHVPAEDKERIFRMRSPVPKRIYNDALALLDEKRPPLFLGPQRVVDKVKQFLKLDR